jgi:hypothetical protein
LSDRKQGGTWPPNNGLQRTALRAAAEAERSANSAAGLRNELGLVRSGIAAVVQGSRRRASAIGVAFLS